MNPLTQEEVQKINDHIATLGPDKREAKDQILNMFNKGGDEWIAYARSIISPK